MSLIRLERHDAVATVTLNRPEVKNAIDIETHDRLCDIWADFRDDDDMRVAVISGAARRSVVGPGATVAGTVDQVVVWDGARVRPGERLVRAIRADDDVTVLVR